MEKHNRITIRVLALIMSLASLLSLTSCFHDNWDLPEREEPEFDLGALLGAISPGDIGEKEETSSGLMLALSEDGGHYAVVGVNNKDVQKLTVPMSYKGVPVKEIADEAFAGLESLSSLSLPESITKVGAAVFEGCDLLEYTEYEGALYLGNEKNPHNILVKGITSPVSDVTVHESTRVISGMAFYDNDMLTRISIPDGVVSIGMRAFEKCGALTEVSFGKGLESIGAYAFMECISLETVDVPDNVRELGISVFHYCTGLEKVTLGNGLKIIPGGAFYSCISLTWVDIGNSVEVIENQAFRGCTSLTDVILPSTLETFFPSSFGGCTSLNYSAFDFGLYLGASGSPYMYLVGIDDSARRGRDVIELHPDTRRIAATLIGTSDISDITMSGSGTYLSVSNNIVVDKAEKAIIAGADTDHIPVDVTAIADYAFYGCDTVSIKSLHADLSKIGDYAFAECNALSEIAIFGAKTIGREAFRSCKKLAAVTFFELTESIGEAAFQNCTALKKITLPYSVTYLGNYAFWGCISLENVILGEELKNIPQGAFMNCIKLKSVAHSSGLISIGNYAFQSCSALESFKFNDGLKYIGESAFASCSKLPEAILPDSLISIDALAFASCGRITRLSIGNAVDQIGAYAFYGVRDGAVLFRGTTAEWARVKVDGKGYEDPIPVICRDGEVYITAPVTEQD